jgi:protein-L-isoaspartate(D-aspartate) O-methyltransferase
MAMTPEPVILVRTVRLLMELRRAGIADARVLGAIEKTPRDLFVPPAFEDRAWDNIALPIDSGQTISQPFVVALMTESLQLGDRHKVLEIGTGSGYQTAVLSRLARRVFTIERHRGLLREAGRRFSALRLGNIISFFGDGFKGWVEQAPFDRIIVTAAAPEIPSALVDQLAPGGILVIPVGGEHRDQRLLRVQRDGDGRAIEEDLGWVRFVPLVAGLPRAEAPTRESADFEVD